MGSPAQDTTVFSRVLYRLSYLAARRRSVARAPTKRSPEASERSPASGGRSGRCRRAADVLWPESLRRLDLPGKQRLTSPGRELREVREAPPAELGSQPLRRDVDRGLRP